VGTAFLVALFLVLTHAGGFSRGLSSLFGGYIGSVKVLQGR
jgi:hypothetical protein